MVQSAFGDMGPLSPETEEFKSAFPDKESAPSPDGAASQGAFGEPATAGKPNTHGPRTGGDMLGFYNNSTQEGRDAVTTQMEESLAPQGKSLEGGLTEVLQQGGPQAWARAAKFGIDLEGFAAQASGETANKKIGQAFGSVPSDEQAGTPPYKTTGGALAGNRKTRIDAANAVAKRKKQQRDAIGAFLMETGLRILASDKPTASGAFGEAALGTMEANRQRKSDAATADMQAAEEKRRQTRADQLTAEHEEEMKGDMVKITDKDTGETMFVREKEGKIVDPDTGKTVREATDADLSAARKVISKQNVATKISQERVRIQTAVGKGFSELPEIEAIIDEPDAQKKDNMIKELARSRVSEDGFDVTLLDDEAAADDPLGLL